MNTSLKLLIISKTFVNFACFGYSEKFLWEVFPQCIAKITNFTPNSYEVIARKFSMSNFSDLKIVSEVDTNIQEMECAHYKVSWILRLRTFFTLSDLLFHELRTISIFSFCVIFWIQTQANSLRVHRISKLAPFMDFHGDRFIKFKVN